MVTIRKNLTYLDHYPRKDHGQNFLSNDKLINKIINFIISKKIDRVVEIGPGLGAITDKLKQADKKLMLICIEKDKKLFEYLQKKYSNVTNFKIINKDVLKIDLKEYVNNDKALPMTNPSKTHKDHHILVFLSIFAAFFFF